MVTWEKHKKRWGEDREHRLTESRKPVGISSFEEALKLSGETNSHAVMLFRNHSS